MYSLQLGPTCVADSRGPYPTLNICQRLKDQGRKSWDFRGRTLASHGCAKQTGGRFGIRQICEKAAAAEKTILAHQGWSRQPCNARPGSLVTVYAPSRCVQLPGGEFATKRECDGSHHRVRQPRPAGIDPWDRRIPGLPNC